MSKSEKKDCCDDFWENDCHHNNCCNNECDPCCDCEKKQLHDHEFEGSTRLAELEDDPHNHRFAGVSSPAIPVRGGHVHKVKGRTDFFDHFHEFEATSGLQIPVGDGKHVHFVEAKTSVNDDHFHELIFATLIDAPIFEEA
ncbi:YmaF family protein [Clostridium tagluense]|nr:YmaF family protein [Clostridium tagluense]WLC67362.1 YmaF family protein [Clostridium tagluense]